MVRRSLSTSAAPRSPTFPEPTWGGIIAEIVVLEDAVPQLIMIQRELPGAALLVVDNPADVCCRIGFDAVPLPRSEMPQAIEIVGKAHGLPIAVEQGILPD